MTTERSELEVELKEDRFNQSNINVDAFMDEQEFAVFEHVEWTHFCVKYNNYGITAN